RWFRSGRTRRRGRPVAPGGLLALHRFAERVRLFVVERVAKLIAKLAQRALQAVRDGAGYGHVMRLGAVAVADAPPHVGLGDAERADADRDVIDARRLFLAGRFTLLRFGVPAEFGAVVGLVVFDFAELARPVEVEDAVRGADGVCALDVGHNTAAGRLARLHAR